MREAATGRLSRVRATRVAPTAGPARAYEQVMGGERLSASHLTPMRTCVRMGPRPWKPGVELDAALDRGELRFAIELADELRAERGRPIDLATASRFLPLIARESPREFDLWSLRWLARWVAETPSATIEQAAQVAASLADLPAEPSSLEAILEMAGGA